MDAPLGVYTQLRPSYIIIWRAGMEGWGVASMESEFFIGDYKPSKNGYRSYYLTSKSYKQHGVSHLGLQRMKTKSCGGYQKVDS